MATSPEYLGPPETSGEAAALRPWLGTSGLQDCANVSLCGSKPSRLWQFATAAPGNDFNLLFTSGQRILSVLYSPTHISTGSNGQHRDKPAGTGTHPKAAQNCSGTRRPCRAQGPAADHLKAVPLRLPPARSSQPPLGGILLLLGPRVLAVPRGASAPRRRVEVLPAV